MVKQLRDLPTSLTVELTWGSMNDAFVFRLACSQQLFTSVSASHYLYIDYICAPLGNSWVPLWLWHVTQPTASGDTAAVDPHTDILGTELELQISPHVPTPSPDSLSLHVLVTVCFQLCAAACCQRQRELQPDCTHAASAYSFWRPLRRIPQGWYLNHSYWNIWNQSIISSDSDFTTW